MKSISASIIEIAAAYIIVNGAQIHDGDTRAIVIFIGCLLGLIGLIGWFVSLKDSSAS